MWTRHPSFSCLTNLKSLCYDLSSVVVRLGLRLMLKQECPSVPETRSRIGTRARMCSGVVSTARADQLVWVDRVSPFKEPAKPSRPTLPTQPVWLSGVDRASSRSPRRRRRTAEFIRAVDFKPHMVEPPQTEVKGGSMIVSGASSSITTSPFPSSAWASITAATGGTPTSPSATFSGSSSNATSRWASTTITTSESLSRGRASTTESRAASSHTGEPRSSSHTSSTAPLSSSSPPESSSRSSSPLSSPSASASSTSASPSNYTKSASNSGRTTFPSRSSVMSTSTCLSSLSRSAPSASSASDLSASSSPTPSSSRSSLTLSSSPVGSSASWSPSGSTSQVSTSASSSRMPPLSSSQTVSSLSDTFSHFPSSVASVIPVTVTTTVTVHIPSGSSTGMLLPGQFTVSGFANNTGAIVGVSVAATVVLLALVFFAFFSCRKYRSRTSHNESTERILALARNVSWRRPVDGSEDGSFREKTFYATSGSASPPGERSYEHTSDGHRDGVGSMSRSHGTSEHREYLSMERPMNPTFDGQPYASIHDNLRRPDLVALPTEAYPSAITMDHALEWRSANPFEQGDDPMSLTRSRGPTHGNATALVTSGRSSPSEHGVIPTSVVQGRWVAGRSTSKTRTSISGPRSMSGLTQKFRKHASTPPSAFMGTRDDATIDHDQSTPPQGSQVDVTSVKNIKSFFKGTRRLSAQSIASTIRGPPFTRIADQEDATPHLPLIRDPVMASPNIYSPSLLNPPIELPPQPLLSFPRGVTGHSYDPHQSVLPWPPATLPPASPSTTDNSSMIEGLLHPKLALEVSRQPSQTSFRDNEDYSRPINGLVKNHHLRSTTTIETRDTAESEDGASPHGKGFQVP